jgi:hypothetical protein
MKYWFSLVLVGLLAPICAQSQSYQIDWFTIDGGGGTSTGGVYQISGTIGQPDAGVMSGGNYTVTGGFWSQIAAIQIPGAPLLSVFRTITNTVVVSWPSPDTGWKLQATANLSATPSWSELSPPYSTAGTNIYVLEVIPAGNKFYRLQKPAGK